MTTKTILIFHRSKNSSEEDLAIQQAFLDRHDRSCTEIINYQSGDGATALKILESTIERKAKLIVILNADLSQKEYDLYNFFSGMATLGFASIYLMDSRGALYRKVDTMG